MDAALPVPGPLRVVAWVGLAFAVIGVCSMPFSAFGLLVEQPATAALTGDPAYRLFAWGQLLLSLPVIALEVAGFAGALRARAWSRWVIYAWVVGCVLQLCAGVAASLLVILPAVAPQLDDPNAVTRGIAAGTLVGVGCGAVFGAVLPVVSVVILSRRDVKEAYASWEAQARGV